MITSTSPGEETISRKGGKVILEQSFGVSKKWKKWMSKQEGCWLVTSKTRLNSDESIKLFHVSFAFQKILLVESVQQFPKQFNLKRPDSGFNWNNEINSVSSRWGSDTDYRCVIPLHCQLCITPFTKPDSLKYFYPFCPQTKLRSTWSLKTLTLGRRDWHNYSPRSVIQYQISVADSGGSRNTILTLGLVSTSWSLFLRLCFGHLINTPSPSKDETTCSHLSSRHWSSFA